MTKPVNLLILILISALFIVIAGYMYLLKESIVYAKYSHEYYVNEIDPTYNGHCLNDKCDAFCNVLFAAEITRKYGYTIGSCFIYIHQRIHRPLQNAITGKDLDICYWVR